MDSSTHIKFEVTYQGEVDIWRAHFDRFGRLIGVAAPLNTNLNDTKRFVNDLLEYLGKSIDNSQKFYTLTL
jgi:hypothetical protein